MKNTQSRMKLFVWRSIRTDYTDGIGFAMAETTEQARQAIKEASDEWEWEIYKGELMKEPDIYENAYGTWISGGG